MEIYEQNKRLRAQRIMETYGNFNKSKDEETPGFQKLEDEGLMSDFDADNSKEDQQEEKDIKKGMEELDFLEKGSHRQAIIGERRTFGSREYIKTATGWKYHGKGTGLTARQHVTDAAAHHEQQIQPDPLTPDNTGESFADRRTNLQRTVKLMTPEHLQAIVDESNALPWQKEIARDELSRRHALTAWIGHYLENEDPATRAIAKTWIEHFGGTVPEVEQTFATGDSNEQEIVNPISENQIKLNQFSEGGLNAIFHASYRDDADLLDNDEEMTDEEKTKVEQFIASHDLEAIFGEEVDYDDDKIDNWRYDKEAEGFQVVEVEQGLLAARPKIQKAENTTVGENVLDNWNKAQAFKIRSNFTNENERLRDSNGPGGEFEKPPIQN